MVRGWNDPGSRISVRFADTSEQRELRRTERSVRDDSDTTASPSRLTIAQAALLNLRGRDQIRTTGTTLPAPPIGLGRNSAGSAPTANQVYNDFSSNAHDLSSASAGGYRGSASDLTSAAKLLAGIGGANSTLGYVSPYHQASPPPNMLGQNQDLTPAMAALLDSLRGNGAPWVGDHESSRYAPAPHSQRQPQGPLPTLRNAHPVLGDVDLNLAYPATSHYGNGAQGHALPPHQNHVGYGNRLPQQSLSLGGGVAQTRSGYTPAEELILSAHASTMRMGRKGHHGGDQGMGVYHRRGDDHADFNVGVRGYRTQASTMALNPSSSSYHHPSSGNLPVVLESDGADGDYDSKPRGSQQQSRYPQSQLNGRARAAAQTSRMRERERDAGHHQQYEYPSSNGNGLSSSNRNYSNNNNSIGNQQSHVRSTTLPPSSTPSAAAPRHYQHNSMSIPKSRNITNDIMRTTSQTIQPQSQHSKHRSTNSVSSINSDSKNHNNNSNNHHLHLYSDTNDINRTCTLDGGGSTYSDPASHHHHYRHNHNYPNSKAGGDLVLKTKFDDSYDHMVYDVPQTSPPLVSPALTYSSRGSGATLSPSTPYVGFGAAPEAALNGHEKFQGRGMETEVEVGDGR
ncbi:hypothetical protein BT96DRAFT_720257 [Gymnopus androsaceus JB14]|uniref:Uncharacterized protein n=1 Tax=Gymnopus androsaceus JB14 TaxID=1447944 RepID=A0A6A4HKW9_9AGAR|nr:hypothetical protein BT96DRAFT_720257 [Gymnopus androsaceus JB14]